MGSLLRDRASRYEAHLRGGAGGGTQWGGLTSHGADAQQLRCACSWAPLMPSVRRTLESQERQEPGALGPVIPTSSLDGYDRGLADGKPPFAIGLSAPDV